MAQETVRSDWELFVGGGLIRTGIWDAREAHDLVVMNADPVVHARKFETGDEVTWADVCAEPWPNRPDDPGNHLDDPNFPYGSAPDDWPYGNGC